MHLQIHLPLLLAPTDWPRASLTIVQPPDYREIRDAAGGWGEATMQDGGDGERDII